MDGTGNPMASRGLPPAKWYPDPAGSGRLRYFDGTDWTNDYSAGPQPSGSAVAPIGYPSASGHPTAQSGPDGARVFQVRLKRHIGLLIAFQQRSYTFTGTLEECERAYRGAQIFNLTAGWWSITSVFLFNWIALFSNMSAIGQVRALAKQPPVPPTDQSSLTGQAPPGWYPDPSGAQEQRYWDGKTWAQ